MRLPRAAISTGWQPTSAKRCRLLLTTCRRVPTSSCAARASLQRGPVVRKLTLPGTIQAYYRAAIYARVSGYIQSWQADIGAHVKEGQVLATIDSPELDQQFAQAKADLATATAN